MRGHTSERWRKSWRRIRRIERAEERGLSPWPEQLTDAVEQDVIQANRANRRDAEVSGEPLIGRDILES